MTDPLHNTLLAAGYRALSTCDQCGQTDDHPKVHIAGPETADTFHHDCLSARNRALVIASSPVAEKIIDACVGGVRGEKLLHLINEQHTGKAGK